MMNTSDSCSYQELRRRGHLSQQQGAPFAMLATFQRMLPLV
jgi:hypothetical protein